MLARQAQGMGNRMKEHGLACVEEKALRIIAAFEVDPPPAPQKRADSCHFS